MVIQILIPFNFIIISMRDREDTRLRREYERLVEGLRDANVARETDMALVNPVLPSEILQGYFIIYE